LKQNDTVSVIIPVFNSERFLKESLESILNQSYKNIEVITVNDGSTDNSMDILQQYSDKITIVSQKNQGLSSALMHGIKVMNGRWFKWFSPDDIMLSNTIETLVNEAKKHSDNTIIYSNWEIIDEKGKKLRDFNESEYNDLSVFDYNIILMDGQQINVNTTLIPIEIFNQGYEFQKLNDPVAIDYDFFLKCAILNKTCFHLIPKSLIRYRIHSTQLSHKNISKTLDYLEKIKNQILSQLPVDEKQQYSDALDEYRKNKPSSKKIKEYGLKIVKNLPSKVSDSLLIFYLNNIRRSR